MPRHGLARALFRGRAALAGKPSDTRVAGNTRGDLCAAQALPALAEVVRLGHSWQSSVSNYANAGGPYPFAPLQASTFHLGLLYNFEPDGGKTYAVEMVVQKIHANFAVGQAFLFGKPWLALQNFRRDGLPLATTGATPLFRIQPLHGRAASLGFSAQYPGWARFVAVNVNPGYIPDGVWFQPFGTALPCANTNQTNFTVETRINGRLLVPPGYVLGIAPCGSALEDGTITIHQQVTWHEAQL